MASGPDSPPPIACRGVSKRYGKVTALEQLDLVVPAGSVTGFLGPNGAGKTTLIRILIGLTLPSSGTALLWGEPPAHALARRRLGYMPADPCFYPALSGLENLDLLAELQGDPAPDRQWALDLLQLAPAALERPVREYSSGMTQKLALVQAVQHHPELIVLDEPANRLDPLAHRRFEELVSAVAARGGTVFLSSHTLSEVQDVCARVAMVRAGRLLAVRDMAEISAHAPRRLRITYRGGRVPERLPDALTGASVLDGVLTAHLPAGRIDVLRALLDAGDAEDVVVEPLSLEEVFVELYEGEDQG